MALLERAQIELNDITDAQPAVLTLAANLSRVQTEDSGVYSPDYSKDNNLIITPTLYVGKEPGKIDPKHITYTTNNEDFVGTKDENSYTYTINQNLVKINSVIITATISDDALEGAGATAQIELVKLSSSSNKYTAIISSEDDKTIFTPTDRADIKLTAALYLGDEQISSGISYQWYKNGKSIDDDAAAKESTYTVKVDAINSMSNYYCIITAGSNSYPTSSITIMDKTDPYSAQIISSSGLIFTSNTEETTLTCKVYQSNVEIEDNIKYEWYKKSIDNIVPNETSSQLSIEADLSEQSVTYYCKATINETTTALAQISLMTAPKFNTVISPKQIFLPFKGDEYQGGDASYSLTFYLTATNGLKIPTDKYSIEAINLGTESSKCFGANGGASNEDTRTIAINRKENTTFSDFPDSEICSISYKYMGATFEEEFYFVKNVNGSDGSNGENGVGISRIDTKFTKSNIGNKNPDKIAEENGTEAKWFDRIEAIEQEYSQYNFLWIKTITYSTELDEDNNNNNKVLSTAYSVQRDGLVIENIMEQYAFGRYYSFFGYYVQRINYSEGIRVSITIKKDNEEQTKEIFDEEGEIIFNENGDILDRKNEIVFYNNDKIQLKNARLYKNAIWYSDLPLSSSVTVQTGEIEKDSLIDKLPEDSTFLKVGEELFDGESLWIRYQMVYSNGTYGETPPMPWEGMNGLRLTAANADIVCNNDSILSIVEQEYYDENYNKISLASYIEQLAKQVTVTFEKSQNLLTFFKMDAEGLGIGKSDSKYSSFMDNDSFDIRFYQNGFKPNLSEEENPSITISSFDKQGLITPQITLRDALDKKNNLSQDFIVVKGTNRGGWSWVRRVNTEAENNGNLY